MLMVRGGHDGQIGIPRQRSTAEVMQQAQVCNVVVRGCSEHIHPWKGLVLLCVHGGGVVAAVGAKQGFLLLWCAGCVAGRWMCEQLFNLLLCMVQGKWIRGVTMFNDDRWPTGCAAGHARHVGGLQSCSGV